jgi:Spo0E like sporulation regulatory protein
LDNKSELEFQINIARNEMYKLSKKVENLTDPRLLSKSEELDNLINEYQKLIIYTENYIEQR